MIRDEKIPELRAFRAAERRLPIAEDEELADLVVPNDNAALPGHQWFKYKEGFSAHLLRHVLHAIVPTAGPEIRLLDPFCGVGTTLLAAQEAARHGYRVRGVGIECNPFAAFAAQTKTRWNEIDPDALLSLGAHVLREAAPSATLPTLSSISTGRCISPHLARRILGIRDVILSLEPSATRDALLLGLAACIEPVSRVRRDGRALRIVEKERTNLTRELQARWASIAGDVKTLRTTVPGPSRQIVRLGDGRRPRAFVKDGSVDLIVTSPPYPNNIDYSEVYKLELWMLGLVTSGADFLALRKRTFRSHPTCDVLSPRSENAFQAVIEGGPLRKLTLPLLERIDDVNHRWRPRVVLGYMHDTWTMLRQSFACLRPGGHAAIVVGNSLHGNRKAAYVIPTDIYVALLAEEAGFEVVQLAIARNLRRRLAGNHFLRDSVVVLRRPHG